MNAFLIYQSSSQKESNLSLRFNYHNDNVDKFVAIKYWT